MTALQDNDAVIVSIARTPVGRARKGGLAEVRSDELARQVFSAVLDRVPEVTEDDIDDLILGCAGPHGEQGFNMARTVAILLGQDRTPGVTVNRFCASSIQAARMAFHAIRAGEGDAFLVGGAESASRAGDIRPTGNPTFDAASDRTRADIASGVAWHDPRADGEVPDAFILMGHTAEYVARLTGTTREQQDEFAVRSQRLAAQAQAGGFAAREIVPVVRPDGSVFDADDSLRPGTTLEALAMLEPAFAPDGTVTAGNACPLNDGASAAVVVSGRFARERGLQPLARIIATSVGALSPEIMGLGPVDATRRLLGRTGMRIEDFDIVELNEAFAAQVIPSAQQLGIDVDRQLNPFGGAIALGHPLGATGVRLIGTLLNGLRSRDQALGLATLCVGGGQGMSLALERLA